MLDGDISNAITPRMLFVFEGGLATSGPGRPRFSTKKGWRRVADQWEIDEYILAHVWDITLRYDYRCDVATFLGWDFADALDDRFGVENIPCKVRTFDSAEVLGRKLARLPDIACVYDGEPSRVLSYGSKGKLIERSNWSPL